jgi:hypothetical protein
METMLIQLTNQKALKLLYELEELGLIKILKNDVAMKKNNLSTKHKRIITKEKTK